MHLADRKYIRLKEYVSEHVYFVHICLGFVCPVCIHFYKTFQPIPWVFKLYNNYMMLPNSDIHKIPSFTEKGQCSILQQY